MTQGLCMFDGAARLVLCNRVYIDMYHLRPEHARPGTPLRDLLMHRLTAGNFNGDPDRYVADIRLPPRRSATRCASARSDGAPLMRRSVRSAPASKVFLRRRARALRR